VYPLSSSWLARYVSHLLRSEMLNFLENSESWSAYKFSWFYRGAEKLIKHVNHNPIGEFKALVFGDDAIWVYTTSDGVVWVCCPDFSGFDATVPIETRDVVWNMFECKSPRDKVLFTYALESAFKTSAAMYKALVCFLSTGVHSGHPLTTLIDITANVLGLDLASRVALTRLKAVQIVPGPNSGQEEINHFHRLLIGAIKEKTPFKLKEDYSFKPLKLLGDTGVTFLGMSVRGVMDGSLLTYYPVADKDKIVEAMLFPRHSMGRSAIGQKERMLGLSIAGMWEYPDLMQVAEQLFNVPGDIVMGLNHDFAGYYYEDVSPIFKTGALPTRDQIKMMFQLNNKAEFELYMSGSLQELDGDMPPSDSSEIIDLDEDRVGRSAIDDYIPDPQDENSDEAIIDIDDRRNWISHDVIIEEERKIPPVVPPKPKWVSKHTISLPEVVLTEEEKEKIRPKGIWSAYGGIPSVSNSVVVVPPKPLVDSSDVVLVQPTFVDPSKATKFGARDVKQDYAKKKKHLDMLAHWKKQREMKSRDFREAVEQHGKRKVTRRAFLNMMAGSSGVNMDLD